MVGVVGLVISCRGTLSPLSNRVAVGREAYAVFVADGEGGLGDLFAVSAGGGPIFPITYTRVDESAPALAPDGIALAFIRSRSPSDTAAGAVWVMNLGSGSEHELPTPAAAGRPRRVAWSREGGSLYVEADRERYRVSAPPAAPDPHALSARELEGADSAFAVWVGQPTFARVAPCPELVGLCAFDGDRGGSVIVRGGSGPVRWGGDSVGYFLGVDFYVRPLGSGTQRRLAWAHRPVKPRQLTYFGPGQ